MFIPPAFAQSAGASGQGSIFATIVSMAPLVLIFIAFYFLMIRPQQRRMKQLQNAVAAVKKGDTVITAGGIVGKVIKVDETYADIEIAANVKIRIVKATIAEVTTPGTGKPAND